MSTDFLDFLNNFRTMEIQFKNMILTIYHEESMTEFHTSCNFFDHESKSLRKKFKVVREKLQYKLKPSHGNPRNIQNLEILLADLLKVKSECSNDLSEMCARWDVSKSVYGLSTYVN